MRLGCADSRVRGLIGIGLPVNSSDFSYLERCSKPKLIVQGTNDEHGSWDTLERLVAHMDGDTRLIFVHDADHFLAGKLDQLDEAITTWLTERYAELQVL